MGNAWSVRSTPDVTARPPERYSKANEVTALGNATMSIG
jgi:hypothetical protein